MTRFLIVAILLIVALRAIRLLLGGVIEAARPAPRRPVSPPVKLVRDPVCGTHIPPGELFVTTGGATHFFCSEECRTKFRKSA
jgi:YHS domain-containing protein